MANLLPVIDKQDIHRAYALRRLVIAGILLIALVLVAIAMLIPSYVASSNNYATTNARLDQVEGRLTEANLAEAQAQIEKTNQKLTLLETQEGANIKIRDLFTEMIEHKSDAISLSGFFYETANGTPELTLAGTARTRDALATFAESLRAEEKFQGVELPIGNLVEEENIEFSLTMQIASSSGP